MRQAVLRPKDGRQQVRWRPEPGAGSYAYLPFDLSPKGDADAQRALKIINDAGCNMTREEALSKIYNTPLRAVKAVQKKKEAARAARQPKPTLDELLPGYVKELARQECEPGYIENVRAMLVNLWIKEFDGVPAEEITGGEIRDVMNKMKRCDCRNGEWGRWCGAARSRRGQRPGDHSDPGIKKRTQDRYFSALSGIFTYSVENGLVERSPVRDSKYKRQPLSRYNEDAAKEEKHFYLSKPQFALVRSKMPSEAQAMLDLMGETGFRFAEATGLLVDQYSRDERNRPVITIDDVQKHSTKTGYYRGKPKNKKTRVLLISPQRGFALDEAVKGKEASDFIFTTRSGSRITATNFKRDVWEPAITAAMRCPEHPPVDDFQRMPFEQLAGPRCGDNGGRTSKGRSCGAKVVPGTNRCASHFQLSRDAVSTCGCTDPENPRRLPRRLTPNDIRHTYTAWLIATGKYSSIVIADRLGNSPQVVEAVYAGILDEVKDQLAQDSALNF